MHSSLTRKLTTAVVALGLISNQIATPVVAEQKEETWTYSSNCYDWEKLEQPLTKFALDANSCNSATAEKLRHSLEEAFLNARLNGGNIGVDACGSNAEGETWLAQGHYVVWRNYVKGHWVRVAAGDSGGDSKLIEAQDNAEKQLKSAMNPAVLRCVYDNENGSYKPIFFKFTAGSETKLTLGLEVGPDDTQSSAINENDIESFKEKEKKLREQEKKIDNLRKQNPSILHFSLIQIESSEATEKCEQNPESCKQYVKQTQNNSDDSAKDGEESADSSEEKEKDGAGDKNDNSSNGGVLPSAAPAWIANLVQILLDSYGLSAYAQFAAIAMMALAPDILQTLADLSTELTAGLASEDLDDVMEAVHAAYKLAVVANQLMESYQTVAGEDGFKEMLAAATKEIRDMPPELRNELTEELGEDFEQIQKVSSFLTAENISMISDVLTDPEKLNELMDDVTDRVIDHVEKTAVSEALEALDLNVSEDLAMALYTGAVEQSADALGTAMLNHVATEVGLSSTEVSKIMEGDFEDVVQNRVTTLVQNKINSALQSAGIDPAAITYATALLDGEAPGEVLERLAIDALPVEMRSGARALTEDNVAEGLKGLALSALGDGPGRAAALALLEEGDLRKASEQALIAGILEIAGDHVELPPITTLDDIDDAVVSVLRKEGGEGLRLAIQLSAAAQGDANAMENLITTGKKRLVDTIADRTSDLDKTVALAARSLLNIQPDARKALGPLPHALDAATTMSDLLGIHKTDHLQQPLDDLVEMMPVQTWQFDLAVALRSGLVQDMRVAALTRATTGEGLSDLTKDLAKTALNKGIEQSPQIAELLGPEAIEFGNALIDGNESEITKTLGEGRKKLQESIDGFTKQPEKAIEDLARIAATDLLPHMTAEVIGEDAAAILGSSDPTAAAIDSLLSLSDDFSYSLIRGLVSGETDVLLGTLKGPLKDRLNDAEFQLLVLGREPVSVGGLLVRLAFKEALNTRAQVVAPDLMNASASPHLAIEKMADARRLALGNEISSYSLPAFTVLMSWSNPTQRDAAVFDVVAARLAKRGVAVEAMLISILAKVADREIDSENSSLQALSGIRTFTAAAENAELLVTLLANGSAAQKLAQAIVRNDLGDGLRHAQPMDEFATELFYAVGATALQHAAADTSIGEFLDTANVDAYGLLTQPEVREQLLSTLEDKARRSLADLEKEATDILAVLHSMANAENPIAFALEYLPPELRPLAIALHGGQPLGPAVKKAAQIALGKHVGPELAKMLFETNLLSSLFGIANGSDRLVDAAVAVANTVEPGVFPPGAEALGLIRDLATTLPDRLQQLIEKSGESERTVVTALIATALLDNPENRVFLSGSVKRHLGNGLSDLGISRNKLAADSLIFKVRSLPPSSSTEIQRLANLNDAQQIQQYIESLTDESFSAMLRDFGTTDNTTAEFLLTIRMGGLQQGWSSVIRTQTAPELSLAFAIAAELLRNNKIASTLLGQDAAEKLARIATDVSQISAVANNLSDNLQLAQERAKLAQAEMAWPSLANTMASSGVSDEVIKHVRSAAMSGIQVPDSFAATASASLVLAGFSQRQAEDLLKGNPGDLLSQRAISDLLQSVTEQTQKMPKHTASAEEALISVLRAVVNSNSVIPSDHRLAAINGATSQCNGVEQCRSNAIQLIETLVGKENAEQWVDATEQTREIIAEQVLNNLFCDESYPACEWRHAAQSAETELKQDISNSSKTTQDGRDLVKRRFIRLASRASENLRTGTKAEMDDAMKDYGGAGDSLTENLQRLELSGREKAIDIKPDDDQINARIERMEYYKVRSAAIKECLALGIGTQKYCYECTAPDSSETQNNVEDSRCVKD